MGRSTRRRTELSEKQRRKFTAKQKLEIVLAGLREDRSVRDVCREHQIQEALCYQRREQLLEAGAERFAGKDERTGEKANGRSPTTSTGRSSRWRGPTRPTATGWSGR